MTQILKWAHLAVVVSVTMLPVSALAQEPPALLKDVPGIAPAPSIGGLAAWTVQSQDFVWLVAPDGKSLIAGYVFDENGSDISSAISGYDPMNYDKFMEMNTGVTPVAELPPVFPDVAGAIAGEAAPAPAAGALPGSDVLGQIPNDIIERLPENIRNEVLARLVEALRPVKTEDEFKAVILSWRAYVNAVAAGGDINAPFPAVAAEATVPAPAVQEVPAAPAPQEQSSTAMPEPALSGQGAAVQQEAPAADAAVSGAQVANPELGILENTRLNTMWFSLGAQEAPVVYAYIDPTCPFCARAMKTLAPKVQDGSLQLRVILAPLISTSAPDVIAGILGSANPVQTFFEHEMAVADQKTSPVTPVAFSTLGAEMADGIRRNYDMVMAYELPGVPFFVYDTPEGEAFFSGVPETDTFAAAKKDAFTGRN